MNRCSISSPDQLLQQLMASASERIQREPDARFQAFHMLTPGCPAVPCVVTVEVCCEEVENLYDAIDAIADALRPTLLVWEESPVGDGPYWLTIEHPDGRIVDHSAEVVVGAEGPTLGPWRMIKQGEARDGGRRPFIRENRDRPAPIERDDVEPGSQATPHA